MHTSGGWRPPHARRAGLGGALALFLALRLGPSAAFAEEPLRIGRIDIRTEDVFTAEEARRGWVYAAANSIHVSTHPSVIRKFLLFREGDPYTPAVLAETERNLRAQEFLKSASVVAGPPHDGVVDVEVVTQDSWTTQPGLSIGGTGGATTFGVTFEEKNFLGSGRSVSGTYDRGTERTNRFLSITDPNLLGPYWKGDFTYASNSDGKEQRVRVLRPFSSFRSEWAVGAGFDNLDQEDRIYSAGEIASRFQQHHREIGGSYGLALTASVAFARRLTLGYRDLEDRFTSVPGRTTQPLQDDRRFRYVFLRYEIVKGDFLKWNYVNRDERYEDFNLGGRLVAEAGISPSFFGVASTTGVLRMAGEKGWRTGSESFLRAEIGAETRLESEPRNTIVSGAVDFVQRFPRLPRGVFVARFAYDRGWRLDREVQFFADGASGLRAYRLHAFEGDKRAIVNAEYRVFSGREYFQLVSPGAAIFADAGTAAPPGRALRLSDFRYDVGVGLRLGLSRAAANSMFRLDLAYALRPDPLGRRGWLVSFASSQAF